MYHRIFAPVDEDQGISEDPSFPGFGKLKFGEPITDPLPNPVIFGMNYPDDVQPHHFMELGAPVVSPAFVEALESAGIDNFELFPARLRSVATGKVWDGFHVLNVIGVVDAADLDESEYEEIMPGSDTVPALLGFHRVVFSRAKTRDLGMFRLLQDRSLLFVHDRVIDALVERRPGEGWGLETEDVELRD